MIKENTYFIARVKNRELEHKVLGASLPTLVLRIPRRARAARKKLRRPRASVSRIPLLRCPADASRARSFYFIFAATIEKSILLNLL